eukprot:Sdes_comp20161_c0_seq1m13313
MKIVALKTFERERKKLVEKKEKEFFFFFFKNSFYFYFKYWTKRFFFQTKTNQKEDKQEMEKPNPTTQILKKPMIYICGGIFFIFSHHFYAFFPFLFIHQYFCRMRR